MDTELFVDTDNGSTYIQSMTESDYTSDDEDIIRPKKVVIKK